MPHVPVERTALDNGLRIILSRDPSAPMVAVNLWYDVGSKHEKVGRTGFAHLFEHMMFQGSANVAKGEHFSLVHAAGGTLNASTWLDRTNYFETLPGHELGLALWLEADRMASLLPAMTQEKLDNQRDVVKNERRWAVDNQPYGDWDERIQSLVYPEGHPYHHPTIGSMEDLSAASLDDVGEFFSTYYAPNNAVLTVAGRLRDRCRPRPDQDPLRPDSGQRRRCRRRPTCRSPPRSAGRFARRSAPPSRCRASTSRIGFRRSAPTSSTPSTSPPTCSARAAHRVCTRTSSASSSIAQDASVFVFPIVGGAAMFTMWVTARPGVAIEALEAATLAEIDALAADGPRDEELERVRNLHRAHAAGALERIGERADRLSMYACLFDDPDRVNVESARYESVDAKRVRSALASSITAENRVTLTYLPAEATA